MEWASPAGAGKRRANFRRTGESLVAGSCNLGVNGMTREKRVRIAVGQISSESNHFVSSPCELNLFLNTGYLLEGNDVFKLQGTGTELGGILTSLKKAGDIEVVPLLAARAVSSGPLSKTCYSYLREHLLAPLKHTSPVDGVILSHHGSMAAVTEDDTEGDIAQAVREIIGPAVPFVMTLDLHGNVTKRMVEATSAILGYEHYPHDDAGETGVRGSRLLLETVRGKVRPVIGHVKLPLLLTAFNASTAWDTPFAQLMRQAKDLELRPGILLTSLFFVGSYIDVPDMGCSTLVVADGDASRAVEEARILAERFWVSGRTLKSKLILFPRRLSWAGKLRAVRFCCWIPPIRQGVARRVTAWDLFKAC